MLLFKKIIMASDIIFQEFKNTQNVNADNMNTFYVNKDQQLTGYFPDAPAICSGIGTMADNYQQVGTSNDFTFNKGQFRFADQPNPLNVNNSITFAEYAGANLTITIGSGSGQQYIVAQLTMTQLDSYKVDFSSTILTTTMTLAEIEASANPSLYLIICAINLVSGVYSVFVDDNCATNYGDNTILSVDFPNGVKLINSSTYAVSTLDAGFLLVNNTNATVTITMPSALVSMTICILDTTAQIIINFPTPLSTITGVGQLGYWKINVLYGNPTQFFNDYIPQSQFYVKFLSANNNVYIDGSSGLFFGTAFGNATNTTAFVDVSNLRAYGNPNALFPRNDLIDWYQCVSDFQCGGQAYTGGINGVNPYMNVVSIPTNYFDNDDYRIFFVTQRYFWILTAGVGSNRYVQLNLNWRIGYALTEAPAAFCVPITINVQNNNVPINGSAVQRLSGIPNTVLGPGVVAVDIYYSDDFSGLMNITVDVSGFSSYPNRTQN
jgi:hypothetical protein